MADLFDAIDNEDHLYISFHNAVCPLCGKELSLDDGGKFTSGGHLRIDKMPGLTVIEGEDGLGRIPRYSSLGFAACTEHFSEAKDKYAPARIASMIGCIGDWRRELGVMALVKTESLVFSQRIVRIA